MDFDYYAAFDRHIGLLTRDEMERVRTFHIGIAGQGGVGGNYLLALTRMGFERFTILDHDAFDESNLNRQVGATAQTLGRRKVEVGAEMAASINPNVKVRSVAEPFGPATVDLFFDGIDFAINAIDYLSAPVYGLLHDTARARSLLADGLAVRLRRVDDDLRPGDAQLRRLRRGDARRRRRDDDQKVLGRGDTSAPPPGVPAPRSADPRTP